MHDIKAKDLVYLSLLLKMCLKDSMLTWVERAELEMKAHTCTQTLSEIFELCGLNFIDKNYNHRRTLEGEKENG